LGPSQSWRAGQIALFVVLVFVKSSLGWTRQALFIVWHTVKCRSALHQ
jgi:hypothetical protein